MVEPSPTVSKKRKHAEPHSPSKRLKIEHETPTGKLKHKKPKDKDKTKSKGKEREAVTATLEEDEQPLDSDFARVRATVTLSIPPIFANNPRRGVEELLDSQVMRYSPALSGVLLSHSSHTFLSPTALLIADSPFLTARVAFTALLWRPRIGMRLRGAVSLCGPDHVGLILHRTFNCSVPKWGLDEGVWEWVRGKEEEGDGEGEGDGWWGEEGGEGWWRGRMTGERLGGEERRLDFTVVGMTIANQMLSLTGSLHRDALDPSNLPDPSNPPPTISTSSQPRPRPISLSPAPPDEVNPTEPTVGSLLADRELSPESAEEDDTFGDLTKVREEAAEKQRLEEEEERERQRKEEKRARKDEKRKRRAQTVVGGEQVVEEGPKKKKRKKAKDSVQ